MISEQADAGESFLSGRRVLVTGAASGIGLAGWLAH
jgi:NADPH:quinone reductase-like Zn-dependent oxidoreductase